MDGTLRKDKSDYFYYYYELEPEVVGVDDDGNVIYGKRKRRSKSTKCKTITNAKTWVKENYHLLNGKKDKKTSNKNFKFLILKYIKNRKNALKETTYEEYLRIIQKYIVEYFKDMINVDEIESELINQYYNFLYTEGGRRKKGLSGNTIQRHHAILHHFFDRMVEKNIIKVNPSNSVELPKVIKFHNEIYSTEEINILLDIIEGDPIETAIYIASLGLRRGEILGLEWKHIDFNQNIMHIKQTRVATRFNNEGKRSDVKSLSSNRSLSIPQKILEQLEKEKQKQNRLADKYKESYKKNDFICCYDDGKPLRPDYLTKRFKRLLVNNNLKVIRLHDIRHSVATQLINSNIPMKTVSDILGHKNISTTLDIYTHTTPKSKRKVSKLQDQLFSKKNT
jgi:integrase